MPEHVELGKLDVALRERVPRHSSGEGVKHMRVAGKAAQVSDRRSTLHRLVG
jgi:hypothetical protein